MKPTVVKVQGDPHRVTSGGFKVWELHKDLTASRDFFIAYTIVPPGAREGPHTRDSEEILLYLEGTSVVKVEGGKTYRMGPNSLISIPPGITHSHTNSGDKPSIQVYIRAEGLKR